MMSEALTSVTGLRDWVIMALFISSNNHDENNNKALVFNHQGLATADITTRLSPAVACFT